MPKDEFDFDDPLELNGVGLLTDEDTSGVMAECFVEEFMMLGYNHKQILALFRNPHYIGMNMVLQNKGEPFVRDIIAETFARWGRPIQWPVGSAVMEKPADPRAAPEFNSAHPPKSQVEADDTAIDPMGNPVPKINV
jgi:hypothetical protein